MESAGQKKSPEGDNVDAEEIRRARAPIHLKRFGNLTIGVPCGTLTVNKCSPCMQNTGHEPSGTDLFPTECAGHCPVFWPNWVCIDHGDLPEINLSLGFTEDIKMLFMLIERFRDNDMIPIYKQVRDEGRMLPEGLKYIDSWVEPNFSRCFQLMECDDLRLIQEWVLQWRGFGATFEIVPVVGSKDTREVIAPYLDKRE